ncbi:hypothetical protein AMELA_G00063740 [Ameiurus melas]|uniref:Uncharacterized protein n=1 Tax=Ameiurus melas TaxID=219545 RepID=A0A7J6B249_AMEME|nr:hypothetical protein AMELA_G00063740 [Ameiurus melas]
MENTQGRVTAGVVRSTDTVDDSIPSIHLLPLTPFQGRGGAWSLSQGASGSRRGTPWTGCQSIAGHNNTHTHTYSYTTDTLDTPISLPCMSLDWERKPEYPEETPAARGEHVNSAHTQPQRESNPGTWRCEANMLTTKTRQYMLINYYIILLFKKKSVLGKLVGAY